MEALTQQQRNILENAIGSVKMEGLGEPPPKTIEISKQYLQGRLSQDEALQQVLSHIQELIRE